MASQEKITPKALSRRFNKYYSRKPELQRRFGEGEKYSLGWAAIVGSEVYGLFAGMISGDTVPKDTDLLLQCPRMHENIRDLDDFPLSLTRFASFYIEVGGKRVDLIYLSSLFPNKPDRSIDDFFENNIYNIQNVAYFPRERRIVCNDCGLDAIESRVLRFGNLKAAKAIAQERIGKKNMSIEEMLVRMMEEKKKQFQDFRYELPTGIRS